MVCLVLLFISQVAVPADAGPKDSLTVYVKNPPTEQYYLDLLTQESSPYDNFYDGERETLNEEMVSLLYSCQDKGWLPALTERTRIPTWGNLVGDADGDRMVHSFGYLGLPVFS